MTDKEIVKAWIVVIKNKRMPTEYLINVTIDRINSLTAEVLRQQAEINVKKRLLDKAEAEIEELKTSNFQFISNINAYKAEIEMDDVEIKELRIALQGYLDDLTKERNLYKKSIEELNQAKEEIENLKDILYDAEGVNLVNYWHQQCKIAENGCRNFDEENKNLKAEIERLKTNLNIELENYATEYDNKIKSEAYREFAERLHCYCEGVINQEWNSKVAPISWAIAYGEFEDVVDYHLKELVGDSNG